MFNDERQNAFPKIRYKARISTFTTIIQHTTRNSSQHNQVRKRNKMLLVKKKEAMFFTCADDMVI
jgi:hypothetical protein